VVAFLLRMPAGIPGDINRAEIATVEAQQITPYGTTGAPPAFGIGGVLDATTGMFRIPTSTDATIYGLLARSYPVQDPIQAPALGVSTPPTQGACSILKRGYMSVLLQNSTAAVKGAAVYVRIAGATTPLPAGGIEAAAVSEDTLLLPSSYFMGPADTNGITEVAYNI
jgi:hypothetical protein